MLNNIAAQHDELSKGETNTLSQLVDCIGQHDHVAAKEAFFNCPRHSGDSLASFTYNLSTHDYGCLCGARDQLKGRSLHQLKKALKTTSRAGQSSAASAPQVKLSEVYEALSAVVSSPWAHDVLDLSLSTVLNAKRTQDALVWLWIVGAPSNSKTEVTNSVRSCSAVHATDELTANTFISGLVDSKGKPVGKDLLSEINGKCLNVKDLSSLFSKKPENLKTILGQMVNAYDGSFGKDTGTRGHVAYDSRFSFLACITPAALALHPTYLDQLGSRILRYHMPESTLAEENAGLKMLEDSQRVEKCANFIRLSSTYADYIVQHCASDVPSGNPQTMTELDVLARLVAQGRAIGKWTAEHKNYRVAQKESPYRAKNQLLALARALAVVHRRDEIGDHDLELVRRCALSTIPARRAEVLRLFGGASNAPLTPQQCANSLSLTEPAARDLLKELEALGIFQPKNLPKGKGQAWQPVPDFQGVLTRVVKAWGADWHIENCWGLN